jgi:hypothetical protein
MTPALERPARCIMQAGDVLLQPWCICVLSCCLPVQLQVPAAAGHDSGPAAGGGAYLPDLGHGIRKTCDRG